MLSLEGVNAGYGDLLINRNIDISIADGEAVALIGRNGVGKSTLAKTIIGLTPLVSGKMQFDGMECGRLSAERRARAGIGYVPQGRGIFGELSVEENLRMGLKVGDGQGDTQRAYDLFPFLLERRHQRGGALSGGQQQMLSIGRVLCGNPRLLLLDEPSDGIQPSIVEEIGVLIRNVNVRQSITTFLIEQNIDLILSCASRCLVMDSGCIVDEIQPELLENPAIARKYLAV